MLAMGYCLFFYFSGSFFQNQLYADMGLQWYYVIVSIYGWVHWKRDNKANTVEITNVSIRQIIALIVVCVLVYVLILQTLLWLPDQLGIRGSDMSYLDAFTTAASIVATWMLARKLIEHWMIWVVINFMSTGMYVYKGMYFYAVLFLIYTIGAIWGLMEWNKYLKKKEVVV